jgi:hypothetical protein
MSLSLWAQTNTDPLPDNNDKLVEELGQILSYQNQSAAIEVLETFKKNIKARKITDQHFYGIRELGNVMAEKKMKRYNFFRWFIATINTFSDDNGLTTQYFDDWIQISVKILKEKDMKSSAFEDYLEFAYEFWTNNYLYKRGNSHIWQTDSKNFSIKYQDGELAYTYTGVNLICFQKKGTFTDSLVITNASGTYYPLKELWVGKTGRVEWNLEGAKDAYADIKNYEIKTRFIEYEATDATMYYPSVFKVPTKGKLQDQAIRRSRKDVDFPRFESYDKNIRMDDVGEGVTYLGGFAMQGARVRGSGDQNARSTIVIKNREGKEVMRAVSNIFDITRGEQVISNNAEVCIYMVGEDGVVDSIYHPGIRFIYNIKERKVTLERTDNQTSRVPFFNSASKLEMNVQVITWPIDSDDLNIGDNTQTTNFDSENFFDEALFEKYTLTSTYNALIRVALYCEKRSKSIYEIAQGYESPSTNPEEIERRKKEEQFWRDHCLQYPDDCPYPEYLPGGDTLKKAQAPLPYDPNVINTNDIARIFDERMDFLIFSSKREIDSIAALRRKDLKIVRTIQDLRDFRKGYPKAFTKGYIYVFDIPKVTATPPPAFNSNNSMRLFLEMAADGFVVYNVKDTSVEMRPKIFHYLKSANKTSKYDYDLVRIKSVRSPNKTDQPNAKFNIKEKTMDAIGVRNFVLSDSQRVFAEPFDQSVKIKKGRDIDFDGNLYAGFVNFFGTGFHFEYDDFRVTMDSVQGIFINIYQRARYTKEEDEEKAGRPKPTRMVDEYDAVTGEPVVYSKTKEKINSVIEETSGELKIDVRNNKSGRGGSGKNKYPTFESITTSRVYYDKNNRQGEGVYPRDNFYYELKPFILEPLDDEEMEKHLVFAGKFYSADILPVVSDSLRLMYHDLSLGFESETPGTEGFPVYLKDDPETGKGRYRGVFGISNEGLIGRGRLDYLGAKIESEYIEFRPENFSASDVDSFYLAPVKAGEGESEYPEVHAEKVKIDWSPYGDSMLIQYDPQLQSPFKFYSEGKHVLQDGGNGAALILKRDGLYGYGEFLWEDATMRTTPNSYFQFYHNKVYSASAAVEIKAGEQFGNNGAWANENVEATVDFDKQTGEFIANQEGFSDLPHNSYKTNLDRFFWDMAKGKILIESTQGKTGFFLSTEETQDSLYFEGARADFDIHTGLLQIDGVEYIRVADAFIYPKNEHVEIEEKAHMKTLLDSKIIADTANQNHQIQRANINILSRREYTADGYLEFNIEGKDQEIRFDNVRVSEEGAGRYVTKGQGSIEEAAGFFLDKKTRFKGSVALSADSKDLTFKGFARITSNVIPSQEWFDIDSRIDKKRVAISFDAPQNPAGQTLHVGLFLNNDSATVYPAILSPKKDDTDRGIFTVKGVLRYEPKEETFYFGDSSKVLGQSMTGKKMSVAEKNGKVTAEGRFAFNEGFAKSGIGVEVIGDFNFFLGAAKSDYRFEVCTSLDFPLPDNILQYIIEDLNKNPEAGEKILYNSVTRAERLRRNLTTLISDGKKLEKLLKKVDDENRLQLTTDLIPHTFFFSHLTLLWSDKTQSFVSTSNLELATINGKHIGQIVKGHVEFIMDADRGDILNFFITSPNNNDAFYFSYQGGILRTFCTNVAEYSALIAQLKKKDRKLKTASGKTIEIELASQAEFDNFRNRAKAAQ